jgi:hypothetical protein
MLTCQNEANITAVLSSSKGEGEVSPHRRGNRIIASTVLDLRTSCYHISYILNGYAVIIRITYPSHSFQFKEWALKREAISLFPDKILTPFAPHLKHIITQLIENCVPFSFMVPQRATNLIYSRSKLLTKRVNSQ